MLRLKFILISTAALLLASGGTAFARHDHHQDTCFATTTKMQRACKADIIDDYYVQTAKCLNSDEVSACRREAYADLGEADDECDDQAEARDSLCARLPDAGPYIVELDPDDFTGLCPQGNEWYPLVPGTVTTFVNRTEGEEETVIVTVTEDTREFGEGEDTIEAIVVNDVVYEGLPDMDGNPAEGAEPIEDTDDYYALANDCTLWYLGEISKSFENGYLASLDGSFAWLQDDAQPGIVMLANPVVGDVYRQEFALGDAEDAAEVLSVDADIVVDGEEDPYLLDVDGMGALGEEINCDSDCLLTEDFVGSELHSSELKYYVRGVGFIAEQLPDGEVVLEMIKIEHPE